MTKIRSFPIITNNENIFKTRNIFISRKDNTLILIEFF
jgi:hypothetical protein